MRRDESARPAAEQLNILKRTEMCREKIKKIIHNVYIQSGTSHIEKKKNAQAARLLFHSYVHTASTHVNELYKEKHRERMKHVCMFLCGHKQQDEILPTNDR